jgi:hypothetical protein
MRSFVRENVVNEYERRCFMKKIFILMLGIVLAMSYVMAAAESSGPSVDAMRVDVTGVGVDGVRQGNGSGGDSVMVTNTGEAQQIRLREGERLRLQDGEHIGEGGQMVRVQTMTNNQMRLEVGGREAVASMNMNQEMVNGQMRFDAELSNGRNAEIKVMPDVASERALERLRVRTCNEENGCSVELKEVGKGEKARAAYELKTERNSRVLGMFRARMEVQAQVDAETGEVLRVRKPWWAF